MLSVKDVAIVYQTLLSSPGMNDSVKIGLQISRRNVLLLVKIMEIGLRAKGDKQTELLTAVNKEWVGDLTLIIGEILQKAGLAEVNEKLLGLGSIGNDGV